MTIAKHTGKYGEANNLTRFMFRRFHIVRKEYIENGFNSKTSDPFLIKDIESAKKQLSQGVPANIAATLIAYKILIREFGKLKTELTFELYLKTHDFSGYDVRRKRMAA
jgi:hypothetical protein